MVYLYLSCYLFYLACLWISVKLYIYKCYPWKLTQLNIFSGHIVNLWTKISYRRKSNQANEETYLSVPIQSEFKSILSYKDLNEYLEYKCLRCSCLDLQKTRRPKFFDFRPDSANRCIITAVFIRELWKINKICHEGVNSASRIVV